MPRGVFHRTRYRDGELLRCGGAARVRNVARIPQTVNVALPAFYQQFAGFGCSGKSDKLLESGLFVWASAV